MKYILLKSHEEYKVGGLAPDQFFVFFQKSFTWPNCLELSFNIFNSVQLGHKIKIDCTSRDMLNFNVLEKNLGIVSLSHSVYDFWEKMVLVFYSINWPSFLFWLPLLCGILGNMCIAISCFNGCDVINFEINLIFLMKSFFCMTKKRRPKFKYLENGNNF